MSPRIFHFLLPLLFLPGLLPAQDSIRIHFKYGSRPAREYKDVERKWFGGIHGGHVSIETHEGVFGFGPSGKFHLVAHKGEDKRHSYFQFQSHREFRRDSARHHYLTVILPITPAQRDSLSALHCCHLDQPPYDYAFLGMRCAASSYDILADVGITKEKSRRGTWLRYFYPRKLRNMIVKRAREEGWRMVYSTGTHRRKWERDLRRTRRIIEAEAEALR